MLPTTLKEEGLFPLMQFHKGIDKLFESFFMPDSAFAPFQMNGKMMPAIEIQETDAALTVDAEMPGLKQEEIQVNVKDGVLEISAERKQEKDEKTRNVHRSERYYGKMERKLALPSSVEEGKVEASYKDGMLHIVLPKKPSAKSKAVTVKVK